MNLSRWIAAMILVAMSSVNGYAQTDQGKVSGTIRDQSTAFVAGAKVFRARRNFRQVKNQSPELYQGERGERYKAALREA